jgi:hypothetical protein
MDYAEFRRLVEGKEKANVDFKIKCDAFQTKTIGEKAELAKDICAMANNGNMASFIIVGVSNDGRSFQSVANQQLTDDNLQAFCKEAIAPPPRVRLRRERWSQAPPAHANKDFVIIHVGPNVRQAHRIARDFISYREEVCLRRNEVWVRRGATSDLAAPEEVVRLARAKTPSEADKPERNVEYGRLPKDGQRHAVYWDLRSYVQELGGTLWFDRVVVPVGRVRYVWRWAIASECTEKFSIRPEAWGWRYEHGVLVFVTGSVSKRAFPSAELHYRDDWGWVSRYDLSVANPLDWYHRIDRSPENWSKLPVPQNTDGPSLLLMTLPNLKDTHALRSAFFRMLDSLGTNPDFNSTARAAREQMNGNIRRWLRQGWLTPTNSRYVEGERPAKSKPGDNAALVRRQGMILRREWDEANVYAAQSVLDLSAGRQPAPPPDPRGF